MSYHPDYTALNAGTHRRPPPMLGAPGVTRQVNYWISNYPDRDDGGINEHHPLSIRFSDRRRAWLSNIDDFLINIFNRINDIDKEFKNILNERTFNYYGDDNVYLFQHNLVKGHHGWTKHPIFNSPRDPVDGFNFQSDVDLTVSDIPGRFQLVSFDFLWHGLLVTLRCTLHNEYFSLTTCIDFSRARHPVPQNSGLYQAICNAVAEVDHVCNERFVDIKTGKYKQNGVWRNRSARDRDLLHSAHMFLYDEIWSLFEKEVLDYGYAHRGRERYLEDRIGLIYFDARAVLLHCPQNDLGVFASRPFHVADRQPLHAHLAIGQIFGEEIALYYADAALPFLAANDQVEDSRIEYTAAQFLDERVIYMSSLAGEHIHATAMKTPIKFLILTRPSHMRQLGRLIERILAMGSVRVAALMNLNTLNNASDELRELTREVQSLLSDPGEFTGRRDFPGKLIELRRRTAGLGTECDGGISYQIERSRYYVQQYRDLIKADLQRMGRVPGFQRYDDFVQRRLSSTYDFINRLGMRLERHKRDMEWLGQQTQIEKNLSIGRTTEIVQNGILKLQLLGEAFMILPLTYYSGVVCEKVFHTDETVYIWTFIFWLLVFAAISPLHVKEYRRIRRAETTAQRLSTRQPDGQDDPDGGGG